MIFASMSPCYIPPFSMNCLSVLSNDLHLKSHVHLIRDDDVFKMQNVI